MVIQGERRPYWAGITGVALIAVIGFGAWWTAVAAHDGEVGSMLLRFSVSIVAGLYYTALYLHASGRRLTTERVFRNVEE